MLMRFKREALEDLYTDEKDTYCLETSVRMASLDEEASKQIRERVFVMPLVITDGLV